MGLPFGPLEGLSIWIYKRFLPLGMDVSMTPLTYDMSMLTTNGFPVYKKTIDITLFSNNSKTTLHPKKLKLYNHKIPIILYYEMLIYNLDIIETKYAICNQFQRFLDTKITGFKLSQKGIGKDKLYKGFNETIVCF